MRRAVGASAALVFFCLDCLGEGIQDKSGFNLFRPTPDALLRELATDRPDKTENPYTVDAGHFQLELDLVSYTRDRTKDETVRAVSVAPFNLKVGLTNSSDLQFIAETYTRQRTTDRVAMTRMRMRGANRRRRPMMLSEFGPSASKSNRRSAGAVSLITSTMWSSSWACPTTSRSGSCVRRRTRTSRRSAGWVAIASRICPPSRGLRDGGVTPAAGVTVRPKRATSARFSPLDFAIFLPSIVSIFCNPS